MKHSPSILYVPRSRFIAAMVSDPGRVRRSNQDAGAVAHELGVYVVCDGMGGAAAGDVASRMAATAFVEQLSSGRETGSPRARLEAALAAANRTVHEYSLVHGELTGMGTTLVALLCAVAPVRERRRVARMVRGRHRPPPDLHLLNVGDSRCYRLRDGQLLQLSTDHSFVEEQLRAGQITAEEAARSPMRSYITRAIGPSSVVVADVESYRTEPGDLYLLCSDGLTRELSTEEIATVLERERPPAPLVEADLEMLAGELVDAANRRGGHDNITVLLVACP